MSHAGIDFVALNLDPAAVDAFAFGQEMQQLSVAAADVKHAGAGFDHLGDQHVVDARRFSAADQLQFFATRSSRGLVAGTEAALHCRGIEKAAHSREERRLFEQERIVALVALDLDERHIRGDGI